MDLSLIIPCHNLEKYITPLLNSLQQQVTMNIDIECIFICDNCTDNTAEIIDNWNYNKYVVKIIQGYYGSSGMARNAGLDIAQGEYIWFLDGDDWLIGDNAITIAYNTISCNKLPMLKFQFDCNYPDIKGLAVMVWQYIYHRDTIGTLRFSDRQPSEDDEFTYKILSTQEYLPSITNVLYYYNYMREDSNMYQFFHYGEIKQ